jgi:hypothetical protein
MQMPEILKLLQPSKRDSILLGLEKEWLFSCIGPGMSHRRAKEFLAVTLFWDRQRKQMAN